jgi:predicted transcriptional regulator of viral defense system
MKLFNLQNSLIEKNLKMFSTRDFMLLLGITKQAAYRLLWRYEKIGIIIQLKRGLYALKNDIPSSYSIANELYRPSYISFDTALSFHDIISETIYTITSATTAITREFKVNNILYSYNRIKKEAYTGYKPIKYNDKTILMAEPEKALADYLYFVDLKKRELHYERMNLKKISKYKLIKYIKLFKRLKMLNLMKKIYVNERKFTSSN